MKNRIWNQTKAAVLAMAAILSGICVPFQEMQVSGAELVAPVLNIEQSAKWTDEENYKAELTLSLIHISSVEDTTGIWLAVRTGDPMFTLTRATLPSLTVRSRYLIPLLVDTEIFSFFTIP